MHDVQAEPDTPLLWVLREQLGLTGTKYGCGIAQCGACTVHVDGVATRSCVDAGLGGRREAQKITTIEGLSPDGSHPRAAGLGRARRAAMRLLPVRHDHGRGGAAGREAEADRSPTSTPAMTNICRCGTYNRVRAAIQQAAGGGPAG